MKLGSGVADLTTVLVEALLELLFAVLTLLTNRPDLSRFGVEVAVFCFILLLYSLNLRTGNF